MSMCAAAVPPLLSRLRYRWCNTTLLPARKFDFNVTCGAQRPLVLPRIGEDRAAVQPPTEKADDAAAGAGET